MQCEGCGAAATQLQCPLCEAEGEVAAARGFFCSQSCFAQHWSAHRATRHPSGVVRVAKKAKEQPQQTTTTTTATTTAHVSNNDKGDDATTATAVVPGVARKRTRTDVSMATTTTAVEEHSSSSGCATRKQSRRERGRDDDEHDTAPAAAADDDDTAAAAAVPRTCEPWLPLPASLFSSNSSSSSSTSAEDTTSILSCVSPSLTATCPRAVVAVHVTRSHTNTATTTSSLSDVCWPSVVAAAAYIARCRRAYNDGLYDGDNNNNTCTRSAAARVFEVLVVAPDVCVAAAFAWAARCASLTTLSSSSSSSGGVAAQAGYGVTMAVDEEHPPASPSQLFAPPPQQQQQQQQQEEAYSVQMERHMRIVVTTTAVLQRTMMMHNNNNNDTEDTAATAAASVSSRWLRGGDMASLLVTLPGVRDADTLQSVQQRSIFLVDANATEAAWWAEDGATHTLRLSDDSAAVDTTTPQPPPRTQRRSKATRATRKTNKGNDDVADGTPAAAAASRPLSPSLCALLQRQWQPLPLRLTVVSRRPGATANNNDDDDDGDNKHKDSTHVQQQQQRCAFARVSNEALTCLVNGDALAAHGALLHSYSTHRGTYEEVLRNTLLCDWGALGVAHAHHRLAAVLRHAQGCTRRYSAAMSTTHGNNSSSNSGTTTTRTAAMSTSASLLSCTLRAVMPLCRLLPPLTIDDDGDGDGDDDADSSDDEHTTTAGSGAAAMTYARARADASASERRRYANFYSNAPTLQLQATLTLLYDDVAPALLDALGAAWSLTHVLAGRRALTAADAARQTAVRRLQCRYGTRLGAQAAQFLCVLMHVLYDTVAVYSCSVRQLERRLLWRVTLAHEAGPLRPFLVECELLRQQEQVLHASSVSAGTPLPHTQAQEPHNKLARITSLSSRLTARDMAAAAAAVKQSSSSAAALRVAVLRGRRVRACAANNATTTMTTTTGGKALTGANGGNSDKTTKKKKPRWSSLAAANANNSNNSNSNDDGYVPLPWLPLPLCAQRQARLAQLRRAAVEEVLMAMPRTPRPMYISDVGNLIGRWSSFNARYEGALGVSLSSFLLQHSDAFVVVGTLVTRRGSGASEPVRVRYDRDGDNNNNNSGGGGGDDSDDERSARARRTRDRALLTGLQHRSRSASTRAHAAGLSAALDKLPARARKRRLRQAVNRARHNRNYKTTDASARVPGYVKHAPRRVKGRGRKVNKRVTKRGA